MTGAHAMATTGMSAVASGGTNLTAVGVVLSIFVPLCGAAAVIVWAYFRLQRHRDGVGAMAAYRKLAEEAVANQQELRAALEKLTEHVQSVEQLMRDVG